MKIQPSFAIASSAVILGAVIAACSPTGSLPPPIGGGAAGAGADAGGSAGFGTGDGGIDPCVATGTCDAGSHPGCGDGILTADEACDDHNQADGDGCSRSCLVVEPGFSCPVAGERCQPVARCGDGVVSPAELCDDGGVVANDGCSPRCSVELGYQCTGSPSVCMRVTCGDGVVEGTESCDVGDAFPYDGCSATCQREPDCTAGACRSECGDFLVIGEDCDDGNERDGDGCSSTCTIEPGFNCASGGPLTDALVVPIVYRDFRTHDDPFHGHPNFHYPGLPTATTGIVKRKVDAEGKPEYAGVGDWQVGSQTNFASWYRQSDFSLAFAESLTLTNTGGKYSFEDTTFFPLDGRGWVADAANPESLFAGEGGNHNFFFTSEVRYWVKYDPAANATLSFRGDDDVWVFVAGSLVTDLGGIHDAVTGGFTLNAQTADTHGTPLGLTPGAVYEIAVFQAERNPGGSNYKLELSGFNPAPSVCTPVCGDGILSLGEQCDDGKNTGGYGKCAPGCVLTEYCGDGIVQPPEHCDDGNRVNDDECNNACRKVLIQ